MFNVQLERLFIKKLWETVVALSKFTSNSHIETVPEINAIKLQVVCVVSERSCYDKDCIDCGISQKLTCLKKVLKSADKYYCRLDEWERGYRAFDTFNPIAKRASMKVREMLRDLQQDALSQDLIREPILN